MMLQLSGNIYIFEEFASGKARGDGSKLCFRLIDRRIRKKIAGENKVCVKIHQLFFFSWHKIDLLTNISMNRTVAKLVESSGEKNEV